LYANPPSQGLDKQAVLTTWEWRCRWRLPSPPPSSTGRSRSVERRATSHS